MKSRKRRRNGRREDNEVRRRREPESRVTEVKREEAKSSQNGRKQIQQEAPSLSLAQKVQ